jgi:hypothetical protein
MSFPDLRKSGFLFQGFAVAIALGTVFCLPLRGQQDEVGQGFKSFKGQLDAIRLAKYSLGPVKFFPGLLFSLQYDSNIYGAAVHNAYVSDVVAILALPMSFNVAIGDGLIISLQERPQYLYYFHTPSQRSLDNSISPQVSVWLLHRFVLSAGYLNNRDKQHVWSDLDARVWQQTKGYTASLSYQTSSGSSFGFYWSDFTRTYEDVSLPGSNVPLSRAWNRKFRSGRFQFNRTILTNSNFFLSFGRSDFQFQDISAVFRDGHGYQLNTGIQFPLLGRARGLLSVGYSKFMPETKGEPGFSGLVANTGVDLRLGRLSLRFTLRRDTPFAYGETVFFVQNWYGGGASYYISSRARLDYNFSYGGGTYPKPMSVVGPAGDLQQIAQKDSYQTHSAAIVFRLVGNAGIGFTFNYWRRGSNYDLFKTDRYYIGTSITYDF